jgi:hypothetical protein
VGGGGGKDRGQEKRKLVSHHKVQLRVTGGEMWAGLRIHFESKTKKIYMGLDFRVVTGGALRMSVLFV